MATIQDVITAEAPAAAWALTEAAGTDFVPYIGGSHLTGSGTFGYRTAGPVGTDFGLQINAGAKVALGFVATVSTPDEIQVWVKLHTNPPPSDFQSIWHNGNWSANGTGLWVNHLSHVIFGQPGSANADTGFIWPDTAWHLVSVSAQASNLITFSFDGRIVFQRNVATPIAPSPNTLYFGGDSGNGSLTVIGIAWPAFYAYAESAGQIASDFLAKTDPSNALFGTLTGGAGVAGSFTDTLAQVLASVRKTY